MNDNTFTSAVGRLVTGDIYVPQTKDFDGKPMVVREGPKAGQPTQKFTLGLAIPKAPGQTHFSQEPTIGAMLWQVGHAAFPGIAQQPHFAWKCVDGDSQIPNRNNRKPCDAEGFAGHWVFFFSGQFAPKCYDGTAGVRPNEAPPALEQPGAIKRGFWVQIAGSMRGNNNAKNPGVYLNPSMVCLRFFGPEIISGPDASQAGFGGGAAPAGASAIPLAGVMPPLPGGGSAQAPAPVVPSAPAAPAMPVPAMAYAAPVAPVPPSVPVVPNPSFPANAGGNVPPPPPAAIPAIPALPVYVMSGTAGAFTREQMNAGGWTDAALIAAGHMRQA